MDGRFLNNTITRKCSKENNRREFVDSLWFRCWNSQNAKVNRCHLHYVKNGLPLPQFFPPFLSIVSAFWEYCPQFSGPCHLSLLPLGRPHGSLQYPSTCYNLCIITLRVLIFMHDFYIRLFFCVLMVTSMYFHQSYQSYPSVSEINTQASSVKVVLFSHNSSPHRISRVNCKKINSLFFISRHSILLMTTISIM